MICIYRIFLWKFIPSVFAVTLDNMNILPAAWDGIFANSTDLLYLCDILVVAQLGYFHWNVTWIIGEKKINGLYNVSITCNETRPKLGLIFSHYIIFFFIPVTRTLAYVLTSSALCMRCWHLCQLRRHHASQPSQNLAVEMACLFAHIISLFHFFLCVFHISSTLLNILYYLLTG